MRVLLTGGSGFLGSAVYRELVRSGVSEADIFVPRSAVHDVRVRSVCDEAVRGRDLVIHLAANAGGIVWNMMFPASLFHDNIVMGANLMDAAYRAGVSKFVQTGTVCSYPLRPRNVPFREDDLWEGYPERTNAPYGVAKKALITMAQAYRAQFGFNAVTLLPANLYGPGDHFFSPEKSHVIPALIVKFVEAREQGLDSVTVLGGGEVVTREFLYVDDAAEAIVLAANRYDKPEPVNVGSGEEVSILNLALMIKELTGFEGGITRDASFPDGQPRRCLDTSRAKAEFGFTAKTSLREGLEKTVSWYEKARVGG